MNNRIAAFSLLVLGSTCLLGCRSASQLAWWKSRDAAAETALADAAPELPSDAAKRVELAETDATPASGGTAAPFAPSQVAESATTSTPGEFPSTGVASHSPDKALAAVADAQPATADNGSASEVAQAAMPYDPNALPASTANASTATLASADAPASRYGVAPSMIAASMTADPAPPASTASTATPANGYAKAAAETQPAVANESLGSDRYGIYANALTSNAASTPADAPSASPAAGLSAPQTEADAQLAAAAKPYRSYPTDAGSTLSPQTPIDQVQSQTTPTATVAATPYRPGGTSFYQTTGTSASPAIELATRPQVAPTQGGPTTPSSAAPNPAGPSGGDTMLR